VSGPGTAPSEGAPRSCGFVAVLGAPNAGKSTLVNALVGSKVSIVSPKVQTTRMRVIAIRIEGEAQIVFVDTPGIFQAKRRLERAMVRAAWRGAEDADAVILLVDAERGLDDQVALILAGLKASGRQAILALNKIDLVRREKLLGLAAEFSATGLFSDVFMISGLTGDGLADLLGHLRARMPAGPWLYPEDQLADMPSRLLASEITREQLFLKLHDELPYAVAVETEGWEVFRNGDIRIEQVIYVQREGQRAIVLGKGGQQIKAIGAAARGELETIFDCRIHLFLHVKVREGWPEDRARYRELGLDYDV
jgi:GTPase